MADNATSNVKLELPPELAARRINLTFHINLIWPHKLNDDELFPQRDAKSHYNFGATDKPEWFVDEILAHRWVSSKDLEFHVKWTLGDVTWESLADCKELTALDDYLELHGVKKPCELLRKARPSGPSRGRATSCD
jgi:hypothetical protein